jgi:hypothetical protein
MVRKILYIVYSMMYKKWNGGSGGKKGIFTSYMEMKNETELISFFKIPQQCFLAFLPPLPPFCIFTLHL